VSTAREVSYVLPLRWEDGAQRAELARYLAALRGLCDEVIVVDGSPEGVFAANARAWGAHVTHVRPDPRHACLMGKVAGVITGVALARHERVVLADDDVRYDTAALHRVAQLLDDHDLVRPQNYFGELPWHARLDTARTLLNRAVGADFPGTLGVRRSTLLAAGGYDGGVMFENLELIRTIEANGGASVSPLDLCVLRRPPTAAHFWRQRTRQAYDDFAIPARMACWLAVLPGLLAAALGRRRRTIVEGALGAILLAERGRRRAGGAEVFPVSSSILAPLWVLERGVCAWLAVHERVRFGGVRYRGTVIPTAAHSERELRRRAAARRRGAAPGRGAERPRRGVARAAAAVSATLACSSRLALGWSSPPGSDD
jgi:hypothetical protein